MPPRYTYWTIILEGKPTAFRARTPEELAPTLKQLQARHPDAVMKWFARGRLWNSEEEAREARARKERPQERRGPDWRPGGAHEDPRARFKIPRDEKRRRFRDRLFRDHPPHDSDVPVGDRPDRPPRPDTPRSRPPAKPWSKERPSRPWSKDRPPARPWTKDRPPAKPRTNDRPPRDGDSTPRSDKNGARGWKSNRSPSRPAWGRGGRGPRPPGGGGRRGGGGGGGSPR